LSTPSSFSLPIGFNFAMVFYYLNFNY